MATPTGTKGTGLRGFLRGDAFPGLLAALAAFCVYLTTLSHAVPFEDAGELAASFATLGVSHPTGYPLMALLGGAFSRLPLGDLRVIEKLNLLVLILTTVSVYLFYRLFLFSLRRFGPGAGLSPRPDRIIAVTGALALGFSRTFWSEAVSIEVYALHLVFLPLTILLFFRALPPSAPPRNWILFAYVLGLSFTNHMMTVLLAPACLFAFFRAYGAGGAAWARIALAVPSFLAGLLAYLYLPIRASVNPLMNWGGIESWDSFVAHVSARQYRAWMYASTDVTTRKLGEFFRDLPMEFGYALLPFAAFGLWWMARRSRGLAAFAGLVFLTCLFYVVNYEVNDPNFYLNAHAALALCAVFGIRALPAGLAARKPLGALLCATLVLLPASLNHAKVDRSEDYAVEDYVGAVLAGVDSGAVVLAQDFDVLSPLYYLQIVEGVRPDVTFLNYGLMSLNWYYLMMRLRDSGIFVGAEEPIARLARTQGMDIVRSDSLRAWLAEEIAENVLAAQEPLRPLYVTLDFGMSRFPELHRVPLGLVFRLHRVVPPGPGAPLPPLFLRPLPQGYVGIDSVRVDRVKTYFALAHLNQGYVRSQVGDIAGYRASLMNALAVSPGFPPAVERLRELQAYEQSQGFGTRP